MDRAIQWINTTKPIWLSPGWGYAPFEQLGTVIFQSCVNGLTFFFFQRKSVNNGKELRGKLKKKNIEKGKKKQDLRY